MPNGRRARGAGAAIHGPVVRVAHPNGRRQIARKADGPIIPGAGGGAGFGGRGLAQAQIAIGAKHGRARRVIAQNIGHHKSGARREHALRLLRPVGIQQLGGQLGGQILLVQRSDDGGRRQIDAAVGNSCKGCRHVEQRHFALAQRQRQTVLTVLAIQALQPHGARRFQHAVYAQPGQYFDGGNVIAVG